ncbi:MAG: hypothetical protein ACRDRT_10675, partial [Pseudonocardiaceae bacterium]
PPKRAKPRKLGGKAQIASRNFGLMQGSTSSSPPVALVAEPLGLAPARRRSPVSTRAALNLTDQTSPKQLRGTRWG